MREVWESKRLIDFAVEVSTGPFGSLLHKSDYATEGIPLVNPINIVDGNIVPDSATLVNKAAMARLRSYVLEEGDVVVARRGEIGRCAVVGRGESGWLCGTGSFFVRPLPSVDARFLAHLLRSAAYRARLESASTGTTIKNLSNISLCDLVVSIPPLPEQRRIVSILDTAFDAISTAKLNAERNLQSLYQLVGSGFVALAVRLGQDAWRKTSCPCRRIEEGFDPHWAIRKPTVT
jgi:type I restriction enzyme S subunit